MGEKVKTVTLEPPWWRCENGNEFRCGQSRPTRCPVCGSEKIEMITEIDPAFSARTEEGDERSANL